MGSQSIIQSNSTMTYLKLVALVALAANGVQADWEKIVSDFAAVAMNEGYRAINEVMVSGLVQYGCWCSFGANVRKGAGPVLDEIDGVCKILKDNYRCSIIDAADNREPSCTPWEVEYESSTGQGGVDIITDCANKNPSDPCAERSCVIEGSFLREELILSRTVLTRTQATLAPSDRASLKDLFSE